MGSSKNVLVLGRGTRAFLGVIRSLGRFGLNVHVAMCPLGDFALRSRYVSEYHELSEAQWLDSMIALLDRIEFALILPCDDQTMILVQQHREALATFAPVYAYNSKTYKVAFDKLASTQLAIGLGIPVPPQLPIEVNTKTEEILGALSLPIVLKPPSSFDENDLRFRREVVRVRTKQELDARLNEFKRFKYALAQENFNGIGVGVELLAKDGEILVAFQHERVHEPAEGGGSSYRRSVELHPALLSAAGKLVNAMTYTGVVMIEFKYNRESGRWIFIEINGRFWGSLPLAIAAGVDFPTYLYRMLTENKTDFPRDYKMGIHSRSLVDDYHWFADNLRANHDDPTLVTVPLSQVFAEFANVIRGRERIDSLAWDDLAPGIGETVELLRRILAKTRNLIAGWIVPNLVIRSRAKRIRQITSNAKSIIFVCYGNICRSSFAEVYARGALGDTTEVASSGFHPESGRSSPRMAIEVAKQMGVDLNRHRSTTIDHSMVETADLIFVFDEKNREAITNTYPESSSKVFYLGSAAGQRDVEISDPYGGSELDFKFVYQQIRSAIDKLARSESEPTT